MERDSCTKKAHRKVKCTFKKKMLQKVCPFAALCNVKESGSLER